ncbi:hypothetical protein M409DRAFT_35796, partial [Zasmidium cellare ATCC 36951]
YFYVEGRYLNFNRKVFGESRVVVPLEKFRGAKEIYLLKAFPLRYYPYRNLVV